MSESIFNWEPYPIIGGRTAYRVRLPLETSKTSAVATLAPAYLCDDDTYQRWNLRWNALTFVEPLFTLLGEPPPFGEAELSLQIMLATRIQELQHLLEQMSPPSPAANEKETQ